MAIVINDWILFQDENRLRRGDEDIPLQPLCVRALALFAENSGEVVTREMLIKKVWNGRIVSEDAINNCVKKIRKALNDNPKNPTLLETIPKKGYRLLAKKNQVPESIELSSERTFFFKKRTFKWLASLLVITTSLVTFASTIPVSMEVVTINSDMSDTEKQEQYKRIMERTKNGGHMIKIEIERTVGKDNAS